MKSKQQKQREYFAIIDAEFRRLRAAGNPSPAADVVALIRINNRPQDVKPGDTAWTESLSEYQRYQDRMENKL